MVRFSPGTGNTAVSKFGGVPIPGK